MGLESLNAKIGLAKAMYLSMPRKEKAKYRERIKELVKKYQPQIERKTDISLGKIDIRDYCGGISRQFILNHKKGVKKILNGKESNLLKTATANLLEASCGLIIYPLSIPLILYRNSVISLGAGEDCIRVPSGFETRMDLWRERFFNKDLKLDQKVVHELSHILWNKIVGEENIKLKEIGTYREFIEGFATFCEQDYFLDIFPSEFEPTRDTKNLPGIYKKGKRKIERIIKEHGREILFQIPLKWRDFQNLEVSKK